MKKKFNFLFPIILSFIALIASLFFFEWKDVIVLNTKGFIGDQERNLLLTSTWLMLIVIIPVFFLTLFIMAKYRSDNKKAKYDPNWDNNTIVEAVWWGVPFIIVGILSWMTWVSCRDLDPFKPIEHNKRPISIQAVALNWKWLFIYPEQKIAAVNWVQFPEQTPINFSVTSDAPMNSFWIPQLGGQIYAMPGMNSKLHLIASEQGQFRGSSANLSGTGFSGMKFIAAASSEEEFNEWVESVRDSGKPLDLEEYDLLVKPTENTPVSFYVLETPDLYDQILMKYMAPKK